mmetsp:Transcript_14605/g.40136  ORF Transcript_14605/g.40136 Transcript_14605/m.40136 type:complete len:205 (+) Transcript_14605:1502-2116(+)
MSRDRDLELLDGVGGLSQVASHLPSPVLHRPPLLVQLLKPPHDVPLLRLDPSKLPLDIADDELRLPHPLGAREAHEAGGVRVATRQGASTAHLISVQRDCVQVMLLAHLVTQLQSRTDHGPSKHLPNSRYRPVRAGDDIHQGLRALNFGILPSAARYLVQWRANNASEVSLPHQGDYLCSDVVVLHQIIKDCIARGALRSDVVG